MTSDFDALESIFSKLAYNKPLRDRYGKLAIELAKKCRNTIELNMGGHNTKTSEYYWKDAYKLSKAFAPQAQEYAQ